MKTYIIGHKKPDTDAVVSAIALASLYKTSNDAIPVISEALNPETQFLFNKFNIETPQVISASDIIETDSVILVDHNETDQRLDNLNQDQIIEIIDHHKANLNLNNPIELYFFPWGSTSTIVYHKMKQASFTPDKKIASIMLAAILSDTVGFKSATTTPKDIEYGRELAQIAEIKDVDSFTLEIFKAKSNVKDLTIDQIIRNDYKVFEFAKKAFINQIETVEPEVILERKEELLKAMSKVKTDERVELVFCAITDILKLNTKLLVLSDQEAEVAAKAFGGVVEANLLDIGPRLSRKKEIAPPIEKALV